MIPLMTRLTKMTQIQAHGTSLVAVVFTSLVGALTQSTRPRGARRFIYLLFMEPQKFPPQKHH